MSNLEKKGYTPIQMVFYKQNQETVFEVETICAYNKDTRQVAEIGTDALKQETNRDMIVENPMKWGVVGNFTVFSQFVQLCIKKVPKKPFKKLKLALCIPAKLSEVEATALSEAFEQAGKTEVVDILQSPFVEAIESNQSYDIYVDFVSEYYNSEYFE